MGGNQRFIGLLSRHAQRWQPNVIVMSDGVFKGYLVEENIRHELVSQPVLSEIYGQQRNTSISSLVRLFLGVIIYNWRLFGKLRRSRSNVVLCNNLRSFFMCFIAVTLAKKRSILFVKSELSNPVIDMIALLWCSAVLTLDSTLLSSQPSWLLSMIKRKVRVVPIGVERPLLLSKNNDKFLDKSKGSQEIAILFLGWMSKEKGLSELLQAFSLVRKTHPCARLLVAGETNDKSYLASLKSLIDDLGIQSSVTFLGWVDEVGKLIADSSILVLPSYSEGVPRSIVESMLVKTAVVSTPVGAVPNLLGHGLYGRLTQDHSIEQLADSLLKALEHDAFNSDRLQAISQHAEKHYSVAGHIKQMDMIFDEISKSAKV